MLTHRYGTVFDADLTDASPTWNSGTFQSSKFDHGGNVLQLVYKSTVNDPSQLQARVNFRAANGDPEVPIPAINSISGGEIDVDDGLFELPDDLNVWHSFPPIPIGAGFEWSVDFTRVGGGVDTHVECHAYLMQV